MKPPTPMKNNFPLSAYQIIKQYLNIQFFLEGNQPLTSKIFLIKLLRDIGMYFDI